MKDYILFNPEIKKRFIEESDYKAETKVLLAPLFSKTFKTESFYNKDIYEMSDSEIGEVLNDLEATSYAAIASRTSYLIKYVDWCFKEKYLNTNINNVKLHLGKSNMENYIKNFALKFKYMNLEQYNDILEFCNNAQDRAIFVLLHNGGRGRQIKGNSLEELRNLKEEDIDKDNNTITLTRDNGETRTIEVESSDIETLLDAYNQEKYLKNNGIASEWMEARKNTDMELMDTGYVFRPTKKGELGKISKQIVSQRLTVIREQYIDNPYISITNIWQSGMIEYAKQIKQEKGSNLVKQDYIEVCKRFGHPEKYWSKVKTRIEKYI
jgi:integrase